MFDNNCKCLIYHVHLSNQIDMYVFVESILGVISHFDDM